MTPQEIDALAAAIAARIPQPKEEALDLDGLAAMLGKDRETLRGMYHGRSKIKPPPRFRVGNSWRWWPSKVRTWAEQQAEGSP